jgi:hypothetical protein
MRTSLRRVISLLSLLWLGLLALLIAWHLIWAPAFAAPLSRPPARPMAQPSRSPDTSFRDTFGSAFHPRRQAVDLDHPLYGAIALAAEEPHSGHASMTGGGFMMEIRPAGDCEVSLDFSAPARGPSLAAVFARVQDPSRPYATGLAFEWDLAAGKQRLWAAGKLLRERAAPGDLAAHTLGLVLRGHEVQALADGRPVLEASDAQFATGIVGFGGRGPLVCTAFACQRSGDVAPAVGAAFEVTEDLSLDRSTGRSVTTYGGFPQLQEGAVPGLHMYWYIDAASHGSSISSRRAPAGSSSPSRLVMRDCALSVIDSRGAGNVALSARGGYDLMDVNDLTAESIPITRAGCSLFARAQDPTRPWAAGYSLTYDWRARTLRLDRNDATGYPVPSNWRQDTPTRATVLAQAKLPASPVVLEFWLNATGPVLEAGAGPVRLSAADATYATGYAGFGARPGDTAIFRHVHLVGSPD